MHGEYAWSNQGSGYWVDGAYRLSQLRQKAVWRVELAGRAEQFFSGQIGLDEAAALGLPGVNTREGEFGLNYYLHDGLKAVASYGRQCSADGNFNLWTFGLLIALWFHWDERSGNEPQDYSREHFFGVDIRAVRGGGFAA
jgi:hypothetical protein